MTNIVYCRGPADPYRPAAHVLRFLHCLDPGRLRLRWSQRFKQWHLERKVMAATEYIKRLPHYVRFRDGSACENDSWVRARDGYILVRAFDALPQLGDWTIRELQWGDPWRLTAEEIHLRMLREEERRNTAQQRAFHNRIEDIAKDQFEDMVWRGGERVAVPGNYERAY